MPQIVVTDPNRNSFETSSSSQIYSFILAANDVTIHKLNQEPITLITIMGSWLNILTESTERRPLFTRNVGSFRSQGNGDEFSKMLSRRLGL